MINISSLFCVWWFMIKSKIENYERDCWYDGWWDMIKVEVWRKSIDATIYRVYWERND